MSKKLTIGFVRKQFEKEGYILLTEEYRDNTQRLEYICPNNHEGVICFGSWRNGHRCLECSGSKMYTIGFIKEQFEKEGYTLLSTKYKGAHKHLNYVCPNNHNGHTCWHHWQQGKRCKKCWHLRSRGDGSPHWNSTLTDEDRQDRRFIPGYDEWRLAVYKRDNFTCQVCSKKGGNLVSHHIESYNSNPDLRTALDNGVCLCEKCHKNFHHQYGYGNNTEQQFNKFKNNYNKQAIID